jgi:hypothetical protein
LYSERATLRSKRAFKEAANLVTSKDLKAIQTSSTEFRKKFKLR